MHLLSLGGKHSNEEILQDLVPKVVHQLADPLAVGGLVARKARAALAVGNAREDALGQAGRTGWNRRFPCRCSI